MKTARKPRPIEIPRVNDVEPLMIQCLMLMRNSGKDLKQIAALSGMTWGALYYWEKGQTRRPNVSSLRAVLRVFGYEIVARKV